MDSVGDIPGVVNALYARRDSCGQSKVILEWLGKYHREIFLAEANELGYHYLLYYGNMTR